MRVVSLVSLEENMSSHLPYIKSDYNDPCVKSERGVTADMTFNNALSCPSVSTALFFLRRQTPENEPQAISPITQAWMDGRTFLLPIQ